MKIAAYATAGALPGQICIARQPPAGWAGPTSSLLSGPWVRGDFHARSCATTALSQMADHLAALDAALLWRRCAELAGEAEPVLVSGADPLSAALRRAVGAWFALAGFGPVAEIAAPTAPALVAALAPAPAPVGEYIRPGPDDPWR